MKALIQKLVETTSPSGYESQIREVIRAEVEPLADEVRRDALGSLIARKGGAPGGARGVGEPDGLTIMLSAHMDEIGLISTHIDPQGYVRFLPIGGVNPRTCPGGRVRFLDGTPGVIGVEKLEDLGRVPTWEQMFIDVGAASRDDCPVKVGQMCVFERPFMDLGDKLVSKAMDDRISVAILIETLRRISADGLTTPHRLFFVFSVQEEVGVRGAITAAYGLAPDLGLAVDVTASGDTPRGIKMETALGKGPAIKVRDEGSISDPRVVRWMVAAAEANGIPYQLEVLERGATDARGIQLSRAGVPVGCLSIPCRYIHSPSEMVDFNDVENGVKLLVALLTQAVKFDE